MSRSTSSPVHAPPSGYSRRTLQRWIPVDVVLILAFAVVGRSSHERGITVVGVLETAWPFLASYALAVGALLAVRSRPSAVRSGLVLWLSTVAGGLVLRALSGDGVALSFQIVTLIVLGVFLVLPRILVSAAARRRAG